MTFTTPGLRAERRGVRRTIGAVLLTVATLGVAAGHPTVDASAPVPPSLDFSAVALRPTDVPGQPYGLLEAEVWHTMTDSTGAYYSSLGLPDPATGGESLMRRINTTFNQFPNAEAAQVEVDRLRQDLAGADQDPQAERQIVAGMPVVGDDSVTTSFVTTTEAGGPVNALEIMFRTDTIVIELSLSDFQGAMPALDELVPLVDVLIGRVSDASVAPTTSLGLRAMHVGSAEDVEFTSDFEAYLQIDGVSIRQAGETEESFQARSAGLSAGRVDDFYLVMQTLDPSGTGDPAQAIGYGSRLFNFASEADAAAYVDLAVSDVLAAPGSYLNAAEVALSDFPAAARAISYDVDHGDGQLRSGFRTWVQSGAAVASVQVERVGGVPLESVEQLTAVQAACAVAPTACAPVPIPPSLSAA